MGLQSFEVRIFFVPKSYLIQSNMTAVHQKVLKIHLKTVHDVFNIIKKYFLCVKSHMGLQSFEVRIFFIPKSYLIQSSITGVH